MQDQIEFYQTIGSRIREIRTSKGLSQADLAEKAKLSTPVISGIENGHSKVWLITFAKICEAEDPFESVTNYYNYMFEYKGSKSKFIVTIIKYTDDEIRFGVLNKTSLK